MNTATKKLIKGVNSYLDGEPSDALVALYYISVNYHGGQDDPLYAVAHQTEYQPNYCCYDGESETVKMVYEEIECYIKEHKASAFDWNFIVSYYNRIFNRRRY